VVVSPVFSVRCRGVQETMRNIQVYVSPVAALWGDFSAAEMTRLLPLLWERTSAVLRAVGSEQQVLLLPLRGI